MKEQRKLTIGMAIFTFIVFISFGVILLNEKSAPYFAPRIEKKLINYINQKYKDEFDNFNIGKTKYTKTKYELKVESKENKNLYFIVTYYNKKITDTYKSDYKEGKSLITSITRITEKDLKNKYKQDFKIKNVKTLNKLNDQVKRHIIEKNEFRSLQIYTLETNIKTKWNSNEISSKIISLNDTLNKENINPKSYNIIIINSKNPVQSIKINNIKSEIITNHTLLNDIISVIIKKEKSDILTDNNITYKYYN